ncbi:S1C family serine protease [Deinococcus cavernae]|nr:S1C family serine protease [Deinococcus cavernae]
MQQLTLGGSRPVRSSLTVRLLLMLGVAALLGPGGKAQTPPPASAAPSSATTSKSQASTPPSEQETQQLNDLFRKLRPATLRLEDCPLEGSCAEPNGLGSGFLISAEGLALTAYHVVFQSQKLEAVTSDGQRHPVNVVGFDEQHDLAVLKVSVPRGTPFFPLAASNPALKEAALVIGNGNGDFLRPKTGRLLSLNADAGRADFPPGTLELSAPLVPGDSGGPVINLRGEAVGVVSYISLQRSSSSAGNTILSYAVPVTTGDNLLAALRAGTKNEAPVIGVSILPELSSLDQEEFKEANRILKLGLGDTPGAFFMEVTAGSPAAQAGLRPLQIDAQRKITPGDVVTAVNGKRILNFSEFQYAVRQYKPGDSVTLTLLRGGKELKVTLKLAPRSTLK